MKEIALTQGQVALVDDEDLEFLSQWKWFAAWRPAMGKFYAETNIPRPDLARYEGERKRVVTGMHRVLMGSPKGMVVDHINHDTLDNRRSNLRVCTHAENLQNRRLLSNNTTGVRGVCRMKGKFVASITARGETHYLGIFNTLDEAAEARRVAELSYFGEFAPGDRYAA